MKRPLYIGPIVAAASLLASPADDYVRSHIPKKKRRRNATPKSKRKQQAKARKTNRRIQ